MASKLSSASRKIARPLRETVSRSWMAEWTGAESFTRCRKYGVPQCSAASRAALTPTRTALLSSAERLRADRLAARGREEGSRPTSRPCGPCGLAGTSHSPLRAGARVYGTQDGPCQVTLLHHRSLPPPQPQRVCSFAMPPPALPSDQARSAPVAATELCLPPG